MTSFNSPLTPEYWFCFNIPKMSCSLSPSSKLSLFPSYPIGFDFKYSSTCLFMSLTLSSDKKSSSWISLPCSSSILLLSDSITAVALWICLSLNENESSRFLSKNCFEIEMDWQILSMKFLKSFEYRGDESYCFLAVPPVAIDWLWLFEGSEASSTT